MKKFFENKKARFEYNILEEYEAGISLDGAEVKAVRAGKVNLTGSFAKELGGEIYLVNAHISAGKDPTRSRKLLLHKKEIRTLTGKMAQKGLALIPLRMYFKRGKIKVLLGLGRGKKLHNKREMLKKKDQERQMRRELAGRQN